MPEVEEPDGSRAADWQAVPTDDDSWTFVDRRHGEACHSRAGAWTEACERYAGPCQLRERGLERVGGLVRLLDVGTGTGLNIAAALWALEGTGARLDVVSLEIDPGLVDLACRTFGTHGSGATAVTGRAGRGEPWHAPVRRALLTALESSVAATRGVPLLDQAGAHRGRLRLWIGDARASVRALPLKPGFDAVFLDPFSPRTDPTLWAPAFLAGIAARMAPGGRLSTYTVSLSVRAALVVAGLRVGRGPRVGTKAAGTLAGPDLEAAGLDERTARRVERRAARLRGEPSA